LNDEAALSTSNVILASLGEAASAFLPQLFISVKREGMPIRSGGSIPRTPARTPRAGTSSTFPEPIPDHLAAAIQEWFRGRGTHHNNGGFITPRAKKLSIIQETKRSHGVEHSNLQRSHTLQTARDSSRTSPAINAIREPSQPGIPSFPLI
jgi:hypothetical protein